MARSALARAAVAYFPLTLVVAEGDSSVTLLEEVVSPDGGAGWFGEIVEVHALDGARVRYANLQRLGDGTWNIGAQRVVVGRIAGRRAAGFAYDLSLVSPDRVNPADLVVETPHGVVYIAAADAERLRGATIGLDPTVSGGAIAIDNPNVGWTDPLALRVQDVFDTRVNPGVAAHGGYIDLLEVPMR